MICGHIRIEIRLKIRIRTIEIRIGIELIQIRRTTLFTGLASYLNYTMRKSYGKTRPVFRTYCCWSIR
jgi:hypothetical protein